MILGHVRRGNLSEIKNLASDMKAKGLVPKGDPYNLVIKGYSDQNDFTEAYVWYREMIENRFLPRFTTCEELLTGLRMQGKLDEAQIICLEIKAWKRLLEL